MWQFSRQNFRSLSTVTNLRRNVGICSYRQLSNSFFWFIIITGHLLWLLIRQNLFVLYPRLWKLYQVISRSVFVYSSYFFVRVHLYLFYVTGTHFFINLFRVRFCLLLRFCFTGGDTWMADYWWWWYWNLTMLFRPVVLNQPSQISQLHFCAG